LSLPVHKIETWNGSLNYTITNALEIYMKEVITDGVGNFFFVVRTKDDGDPNYYYNDIALFDKVKIWLGWDSIGANPNFVGRVANISAPLDIGQGYVRVISGLSQGEILLRRFKTNKIYSAVEASTIVEEWASDLGLGDAVDATSSKPVTLEIWSKNYFDLLREISDYWISDGTQIKRDFLVDINNNLVWKDRPLRSSGVETLTVGSNIDYYNVKRDVDAIRNNIKVYGQEGKIGVPGEEGRKEPTDGDNWTLDSVDNWIADLGSKGSGTSSPKVPPNYLQSISTSSPPYQALIKRSLSGLIYTFGHSAYQTVNFYFRSAAAVGIRLYAPNASNYFERFLGSSYPSWSSFQQLQLGENQTYNAITNPDGIWNQPGYGAGSPQWGLLSYIAFYSDYGSSFITDIDGLYFGHGRWRGTALDLEGAGSSGQLYGQRDLEAIDDKLHSDSDCSKRAKTLLYQKKDPPILIDVSVKGNTNILVGDQLTMTIPAENISAQPFHVLSVEHFFNTNVDFITKASMINSGNLRTPIETEPIQMLSNLRRQLRALAKDEKEVI